MARWAWLPNALLDLCVRRIIDEVPGISLATHDISGRPPATIAWEWRGFAVVKREDAIQA